MEVINSRSIFEDVILISIGSTSNLGPINMRFTLYNTRLWELKLVNFFN